MSTRKAIFITGGGSGIGRAIALYFGERGWFVGLGDVNREGMEDTDALLPGGHSYIHQFDVRDRDAWDVALQAFSVAAGGRIDVVVNNAGIAVGGDLVTNSRDEIDRCIDINVKGVLYGAQAAHPHLLKAAPGSCLLNIASLAGINGAPGMAPYCASKFAVRGITETLDAEWAADGIKVASLCPAFIDTPLLDQSPNAKANHMIRDQVHEMGMEITPAKEVAQAAWDAVNGDRLHTLVGKSAHRLNFAKRWFPARLRKQMKAQQIKIG